MKARDASCPVVRPPWNLHFQVRAEILTTYALCGFANFSSIGIMLGGLSESLGWTGGLLGAVGTISRVKGRRSQVNGGQTPSPRPLSATLLFPPTPKMLVFWLTPASHYALTADQGVEGPHECGSARMGTAAFQGAGPSLERK